MDAKDRLFAEIAVRLQLLSREQIARCGAHAERTPGRRMAELAIELGFLSEHEAELIRNHEARAVERPRGAPGAAGMRSATAPLVEERAHRPDPRSASAPPELARPPRPQASPQRAVSVKPSVKRSKRAGPQAWEAPAEPAQGQVHIPRAKPAARPLAITIPIPPAEARPSPAAPSVDVSFTGELEDTPPKGQQQARARGFDSFPVAPPESRADSRNVAAPSSASASSAATGIGYQRTLMQRPAGAASTPQDNESARAPVAPLQKPATPSSSAAVGATLIQAFAPLRNTPGAMPAVSIQKPAAEPLPLSAIGNNGAYLARALALAAKKGGSDLHVHSGMPLMVRVDGDMVPLSDGTLISAEAAEKIISEVTTPAQWTALGAKGEIDFAYALPGIGRFRANVYRQQRGLDAVFRIIELKPPTLEELGLPSHLERLIEFRTGLVLCTGPTRSGKSSTLAALLSLLVQSRADHVLTIEDPVEFVFPPGGHAHVTQRQIGDHTNSFSRALRAALREDPDVIAITELRDRETISLAMTAAETGHLVLGTLHTANAAQTINRIVSAFPASEQEQVRSGLADSLRAVVSQRLVKKASGGGRVPAIELLMVNTAVSNLIRDDKTFQLGSVMQTGKAAGMVMLDDSLLALCTAGTITTAEARRVAVKKERFV